MNEKIGFLAEEFGYILPLQVLKSAAGYYIGTFDQWPISRESEEYWLNEEDAEAALRDGAWTQRLYP